jgi:hypothetical protein
VRPGGTRSGPTSANGTRTYSAWPPANPPVRCEYPKIPETGCPNIFSDAPAFGLEFSQHDHSPRTHAVHAPQAIGNGTTTRSPTRSRSGATPGPTSSPRTSPFCMVGT